MAKCITTYTGEIQSNLPPVSIVICTRDDFATIKKDIPILLNQEYPDFEIIIVNYTSDSTNSDSFDIWAKQNKKITVVKLNEKNNFECSKIYPLAIGIKASKNDLILTTSINCRPTTIHWIRSMVSKINNNDNVIGISNFAKKNTFFNKLMRYEMAKYNINLFSYLLTTNNYYVDSNNFLFKKKDFINRSNLSQYFTTANDGCVIFNELINNKKTGKMVNDYSHINNYKKLSWSSWFNLVTDRIANFRFTTFKTKLLKALYIFTLFVFFSTTVILPIKTNFQQIITYSCYLIFIIRFFIWYFSLRKSLKEIGQNDLKFNIIFYEIILLFLHPINYLLSLTIKKNIWV